MFPITGPLALNRQTAESSTAAIDRAMVVDEQYDRFREVSVGQSESEVVYTENKLSLHRYEPDATVDQEPVPILIVYALINRPYILDLQPDRSVIQQLLAAGFRVYMIDWGEPSLLDTSLTLGDYVDRYIGNCVDIVREDADIDSINLLGYCMGGTMAAMFAARRPESVRNLGLMAAGLHFDRTGGVLEVWGDNEEFSSRRIADTFGNVPAEFLDIGFALMDPVQNFLGKYLRLYDNLEDEDFVENFARMERWLGDGIDLAGETYVEFIEDLYRHNALCRNEFVLDGEAVDLEDIDMPILQIVGEYDHLIPMESSTPFNNAVASEDTTTLTLETGHIGLSVSSRSHEELWPDVCEWFSERSHLPTDPVEHLQSISGIGSTYAERLAKAGFKRPADLASADPDTIADAAQAPRSRVDEWLRDPAIHQ